MTPNTLITTYYDNPDELEVFLSENYNPDYFSNLIVVDDASPKYPARDILKDYGLENVKLYRILEDYGFNSHGARNLAMLACETEWATCVDLDHILLPKLYPIMEEYIELEYGKILHFAWNQFCVQKIAFWAVGGYDEDLSGYKWGDTRLINKFKAMFEGLELDLFSYTFHKKPFMVSDENRIYLQEYHKFLPEHNDNKLSWFKHKKIKFDWVEEEL